MLYASPYLVRAMDHREPGRDIGYWTILKT